MVFATLVKPGAKELDTRLGSISTYMADVQCNVFPFNAMKGRIIVYVFKICLRLGGTLC